LTIFIDMPAVRGPAANRIDTHPISWS